MANKEQIQSIASEFKWDEKKLLEKLANEKNPDFSPREEFKEKLDAKIQNKIKITKEQREDQAAMDAVPRKLKWRFYLTGYGYAVVSFVALFLIWFCTNIFTWTLKVPEKYTYLEESKAFWDLSRWWELTYGYGKDVASNYSYYDSDEDYETEESIDIEDTSTTTKTNSFVKNITKTEWQSATMSATEGSLSNDWWEFDLFWDLWLNKFMYNQTYRFGYKDKLFPRLDVEYPIYKISWILIWSNTPNQVLKNLKIWDVSFKKFQDLEIAGLYIEQKIENGYYISFDSQSHTLSFYPNDSRQAQNFDGKLPSKRQIIKATEKDLKQLGVSTKNYGDGEVDIDNYDESMWIVSIFYPFEIQWKEVWDVEMGERIWIKVEYDLNLQKVVSIVWIDIATYNISNYPTSEKSNIESWIEKWWEFFNQWALHENSTVVLFGDMEIVYIPKYSNWITYYVPAIRWEVKTSVENYKWPKNIFQEIVQ